MQEEGSLHTADHCKQALITLSFSFSIWRELISVVFSASFAEYALIEDYNGYFESYQVLVLIEAEVYFQYLLC